MSETAADKWSEYRVTDYFLASLRHDALEQMTRFGAAMLLPKAMVLAMVSELIELRRQAGQ